MRRYSSEREMVPGRGKHHKLPQDEGHSGAKLLAVAGFACSHVVDQGRELATRDSVIRCCM